MIFIKGNVHNFLNGCDKKCTKDGGRDEKSFFRWKKSKVKSNLKKCAIS